MLRFVSFFMAFALLVSSLGCASSSIPANRPAQPISTLATHRAGNNSTLLEKTGTVFLGIGKGALWVVGELLSPLNALRKGLVHLFGVTSEEAVVEQKNLPPSGFHRDGN